MSFKIISDHERDQVVDDLLKRFPQGPHKRLTRDDYEVKEQWSSFKNCYAKRVESLVPNFGYAPEKIVRVHWAMNEEKIRLYIRERWPPLGSRRYHAVRIAWSRGSLPSSTSLREAAAGECGRYGLERPLESTSSLTLGNQRSFSQRLF